MPELVDELPIGSGERAPLPWKAPALKMARDNPGLWVRCDGEHPQDTPGRWREQRTGRHCLPDGFEVAGRQQGAPAGRVFVYVRWVGGERTDVVGPSSDVVEAALRVQYNSDTADPPARVLAEYVLSQIGEPDA